MRNLWGKHGVAAGVVLVLVLGLLLLAFSATAGAKVRTRPFQGYMTGQVSYVLDPASPTGMYTYADAVGDVSHMGESTWTSVIASAFYFEGDMTLTAANGATLAVHFTGGSDPADLPAVGEWYDVPMEGTIVGGSGRFAAATGSMDITMSLRFMGFEAMVWPGTWSWTGTIRY
jgi:hypothetical protein